MSLRTYDDPAHGAGKNIGMGYNFKANEKTARQDLRRASVPEEPIRDVLAGKARLTPDQAKRLLITSLQRYDKQAQEAAEASSTGLWKRMTPAQKAVMVDIAWQTGNPEQFRKAWKALALGDMAAFAEESKVYFTGRTGERRQDTRRNNLRASMLAGRAHRDAVVGRVSGSLGTSCRRPSWRQDGHLRGLPALRFF